MSYDFQVAQLSDTEELLDVILRAYEPIRELGINFEIAYADIDLIQKNIRQNICYVLRKNNNIVSTISIRFPWGEKPCPTKYPHLGYFAVDPLYKKQGIGNMLLTWVEEEIIKKLFKSSYVTLGTAQEHPWLVTMYQKRGYKEIGTVKLGRGHTTVYLQKKLKNK